MALCTAEPAKLAVLRKAYPDVTFTASYDDDVNDWLVTVSVADRSSLLYWQDGRMLPKEELSNKDSYWTLLYEYERELKDPATFTSEDIESIRAFTDPKNRTEGAGTPPFFYDVLYDCASRAAVERHIVRHIFLGKSTNIHERLCKPLDRVQARINTLSRTNSEVKAFIASLESADSYSWRAISDSRKRSFHSIGIAVDVLPKGWRQKNIYWAWRRDIDPKNWMLLPLERRWMPPAAVIDAFEQEGFIWGGKWMVWDNMHFEYHPELLLNYMSEK